MLSVTELLLWVRQSALYSAFQRRKAAVDEGKAKERMEKKQARGGGFQDEGQA